MQELTEESGWGRTLPCEIPPPHTFFIPMSGILSDNIPCAPHQGKRGGHTHMCPSYLATGLE